jgi:hypothetical protein
VPATSTTTALGSKAGITPESVVDASLKLAVPEAKAYASFPSEESRIFVKHQARNPDFSPRRGISQVRRVSGAHPTFFILQPTKGTRGGKDMAADYAVIKQLETDGAAAHRREPHPAREYR